MTGRGSIRTTAATKKRDRKTTLMKTLRMNLGESAAGSPQCFMRWFAICFLPYRSVVIFQYFWGMIGIESV